MFACIIALDNVSAPNLLHLVMTIKETHPKALILFIEHMNQTSFSNGALFNICVQLVGFSPVDELCFFSFIRNQWTISPRVSVADFLKSNGYNNHSVNAATLVQYHNKTCGYNEIFAATHIDIKYNQYCYHYTVIAAPDKILQLNFVH